jgi:hypothetical protein
MRTPMKSLLDDRFVPLTHQIGFLEGNFETIADVYLRWQRSLHGEVSSDVLNAPLAAALQRLEPLTTPWEKELFIATNSRWVAYFNNGLRGSDPESPIGHLATIVPCRGLVVHCTPDRSSVTAADALRIYSVVSFTMFAAHQTDWLNQERAICAMNDGGKWVFVDQGIPQAFENPEKYKARLIRDRFTPEMLKEYCAALDIRIFDETFYGGKTLIAKRPNQIGRRSPVMSLHEARRLTLMR